MKNAIWVLMAVLALTGCGNKAGSENVPVTLEYQLATVAAGHPIEPSDTSVVRAKLLLALVSTKYEMPQEQLADQVAMIGKLMKEKGLSYDLMDIMEASLIATSTDSRFVRVPFPEFGSTYIALRSGNPDMNHWMVVRSIVGIQNAMMTMSSSN